MSRVFHPVKTKFRHAYGGRRASHFRRLCRGGRPVIASPSAKLVARPVGRLQGRVRAPGDKSISHRSLMLGALALGETDDHRPAGGRGRAGTAAALRALGARGRRASGDGVWRVRGFGVGGGREPADVLDLGNAGTGARCSSGILASHPLHQLHDRRRLAALAGRCSG